MKRIRTTSIALLFFNSISALWGGVGLIYDPSGDFMQMPLSFLQYSPFSSYLIPGIILLTANGLLGLAVAILTIRGAKYYQYLVILQGIILSGWLSVQIALIREFYAPLHLPYYIVGLGLIICGSLLLRTERNK